MSTATQLAIQVLQDHDLAEEALKLSAAADGCRCQDCTSDMAAELAAMRKQVQTLRDGINAVASLIAESHGVAGLHLNGDVAPWDELRTGGRFEQWLLEFDAALSATATAGGAT